MLSVLDHRRHFGSFPPDDLAASYPYSLSPHHSTFDAFTLAANPSPSELSEKVLRTYFAAAAASAASPSSSSTPASSSVALAGFDQSLPDVDVDIDAVATQSLMTTAPFDVRQNPAIRIQQSTPVPQLPGAAFDDSTAMLATDARNWPILGGGPLAANNTSLRGAYHKRGSQLHQRALSSSSVGSSGSSPQYGSQATATAAYAFSGLPDTTSPPSASSALKVESSSFPADQSAAPFSNHLPTPSQTPTSDSFLNPTYQAFGHHAPNYDNTMTAHYAMRQMVDPDDDPGYTHSSRQSVSSFGNSPATPRTVAGDDFEDKYKPHSSDLLGANDMAKPDGATQDSFPAFYYTAPPTIPRLQTQHASQHAKNQLLSPYRTVMAERLQAANIARSQSPTSSTSGALSPFRHGSPLAPVNHSFGSPRQRFGTAAQIREQQTADATTKAFAMKNRMSQNQEPEPKTISPKDALLEYNESEEDTKMPLFPPEESAKFNPQLTGANGYEGLTANFGVTDQGFDNIVATRGDSWVDSRSFGPSYPTTTGASAQSTFSFVQPSVPASIPVHAGLSFAPQPFRPTSIPPPQESTPEFPSHLTSMDSSASEAGGPQDNIPGELQKPGPSTASTGTYSCTYHGCPQRFETPQKLQKHKREGHRQNPTNVTSGIGSGMSAADLLARNSQAGPHKCERINPTTGKPCNTIFSRPYDLTRHEDTIHNIRKQKVRCALCVEEKTFSRNDALTRHMRVVHPEVDFPGKHRRRGHGSHD